MQAEQFGVSYSWAQKILTAPRAGPTFAVRGLGATQVLKNEYGHCKGLHHKPITRYWIAVGLNDFYCGDAPGWLGAILWAQSLLNKRGEDALPDLSLSSIHIQLKHVRGKFWSILQRAPIGTSWLKRRKKSTRLQNRIWSEGLSEGGEAKQ